VARGHEKNCPPSTWNGVRHQNGIAVRDRWNTHEYGDLSMQQRACVEAWRKADFSVRYGRSAPNELRNFVRAAAAAIPHDDLRLLVVNRDLRIKGEVVTVRCGWEMQLLSWVTSATFACHVIFLSVLTPFKKRSVAHNLWCFSRRVQYLWLPVARDESVHKQAFDGRTSAHD
jgi:hypothetical protein